MLCFLSPTNCAGEDVSRGWKVLPSSAAFTSLWFVLPPVLCQCLENCSIKALQERCSDGCCASSSFWCLLEASHLGGNSYSDWKCSPKGWLLIWWWVFWLSAVLPKQCRSVSWTEWSLGILESCNKSILMLYLGYRGDGGCLGDVLNWVKGRSCWWLKAHSTFRKRGLLLCSWFVTQ